MNRVLMSVVRISILLGMFACGVLASCAILAPKIHDGDLKPYVKSFAEEIGVEVKELDRINITFLTLKDRNDKDDKEGEIIGTCQMLTGRIHIDPTFFYSSWNPEIRKKSLIYHELMHCFCYVKHDNSEMDDGCPTTIINEYNPDYTCLKKHWETYMDDMFERCD